MPLSSHPLHAPAPAAPSHDATRLGSARHPRALVGPFVPSLSVRAGGRDGRRGGDPRGSRPGRSPGVLAGAAVPPGWDRHPAPHPRWLQRLRFVSQCLPPDCRVRSGAAPARRGAGLPARGGERARRKTSFVSRLLLSLNFEAALIRGEHFSLGQAPSAAVGAMSTLTSCCSWALGCSSYEQPKITSRSGWGWAGFLSGTLRPSHKN